MANILEIFNNSIPLTDNIQWQYDNAPNIKSLIESKENWYAANNEGFWQDIINNFLNIATANNWGLGLWGKILEVPRIYNVNGQDVTISTELYRRLILGKLRLINSDATVPEIMDYCNFVFSNHVTETSYAVLVRDNLDMTVTYLFNFDPNDEELALIYSRTFFPTPAGVLEDVYITPANQIFGFYGSGFQPFNQAPFWDGRYLR